MGFQNKSHYSMLFALGFLWVFASGGAIGSTFEAGVVDADCIAVILGPAPASGS